MSELTDLQNRLQKKQQQLRRWREREGIEAYRLYDEDMPEFPLIIDVFGPAIVVYDKARPKQAERLMVLYGDDYGGLRDAVADALGVSPDACHIKARRINDREQQYEKIAATQRHFAVREGDLRFLVNVSDYLDCGLFLDQRHLRQEWARGDWQGRRFLNLFCYTGAMSVAVASRGAQTTNVDMSNTYLAWAERNFALNDLSPSQHRFVRADIMALLDEAPRDWQGSFDLIYLDPPIFSRSKKMLRDFDVLRDHPWLIRQVMAFLAPQGRLVFSTPRQRFKLDPELAQSYVIENISQATIPEDMRNKRIHSAFNIGSKP